MPDFVLTADAAVDLAFAKGVPAVMRLVLLAAERSDADGVAPFDPDELYEALRENLEPHQKKVSRAQVAHKVRLGVTIGYFREGSTVRRVLVNTDLIRPLGWGLRVVAELDGGRVLCECPVKHRSVYRADWVAEGKATCAGCQKKAAA